MSKEKKEMTAKPKRKYTKKHTGILEKPTMLENILMVTGAAFSKWREYKKQNPNDRKGELQVNNECLGQLGEIIKYKYDEKLKALYNHYGFKIETEDDFQKYALNVLCKMAEEHIKGFKSSLDKDIDYYPKKAAGRSQKWGADFVLKVEEKAKEKNLSTRNAAYLIAKKIDPQIKLDGAKARYYEAKKVKPHFDKCSIEFDKTLKEMEEERKLKAKE